MNRRNLMAGVRNVLSATSAPLKTPPIIAGLDPYQGPWSQVQAAHLLRRTMFGPSLSQIKEAAALGLDQCITKLMDGPPATTEGPKNPGKFILGDERVEVRDPYVETDESWIKKTNGAWEMAPLPTDIDTFVNVQSYRNITLRTWKTEQILKEGISIFEKMTLFWHNHFGLAGENGAFEFLHNITLQENALGNFRDLVKKTTLDPAMLLFLNGNESTSLAPNENYARELLELFTIGKGRPAGPGDYTNYTEKDIGEAARVLTGWAVNFPAFRNHSNSNVALTQQSLTVFHPEKHDSGTKQFSHRFNNKTISSSGSNEVTRLIDMIFEQDECARFICRKLYRWFVFYAITDGVETQIIEPMAQILIANNYHIQPAIEALLKSEHFYDMTMFGQMIKNPYDFVMSIVKPLGLQHFATPDPFEHFRFHLNITQLFTLLQMTYFKPPNVAGWKAYYQEPLYYRTWINATTLNYRMQITQNLTKGGEGEDQGLNVLQLVNNTEDAQDPNQLIEMLSNLFFPQSISQAQKDYLKGILIPGLPDFEWTVEYRNYLDNPDDQVLTKAVDHKLRSLFNAMTIMPEFYLS